jgi:radical SAM family uncharacterized protein
LELECLKVLSANEIESRLENILLRVQKPGRYVGGEYNQIVKSWNLVETRVALAFPDLYDIGLPNLGIGILYDILNQQPDILAERAYLPWADMEAQMKKVGIPLFSLESKHSLAAFDIIGITLPYETLYTNALQLLDLAEIPLLSQERNNNHPLVIAGGHSTYNPEPMSAFIDAFVIGEGEEVILEVVRTYQAWKQHRGERVDLLRSLSSISGVYVPSLYVPRYNPDHTIASIEPLIPEAPRKILKRILGKLPPPPTRFFVPNIDVVHNRVAIEIMRGCTRGCRFCHAGMVTRPVRERSVDEIVDAIETALDNTGFEEVALLSLSSSDYTHIHELVQSISTRFDGRHLSISLPSLRIESFSVDLLEQLKGARQGGFTLAPEAATDRMRSVINKPISSEQLLEVAHAIYSRGWLTLKLYFMIGHPSETLEDVHEIANLCRAVLAEGKKTIGRRANLHAGVSTFVPKPHTPFQWIASDTQEQIEAKQALLRNEMRVPGMKLNWTDPHETLLEAWLSRGDRRMSAVIYSAWQNGARFDAWQDQFRFDLWMQAFHENGIDPAFYTHRNRSIDEILPWDHIFTGVSRAYLVNEFQASKDYQLRSDCREQCYACGLLPAFRELRRQNPGADWKCPPVSATSVTVE